MAKKDKSAKAPTPDEVEAIFSDVDETGHTNASKARKERTRRRARKAAVEVDPLSGDDPSGSNVGKTMTRAAVVVLKNTKSAEAAAEFASWLNGSDDTQETLISVGGLFPSTVNGLASPALLQESDFYGGQVVNEVFIEAAGQTPATWVEGPNYGTIQTALLDEFAKVVNGEETFLEALDIAQAAAVADLKARGLSVTE